jgi:hypothetical protein
MQLICCNYVQSIRLISARADLLKLHITDLKDPANLLAFGT